MNPNPITNMRGLTARPANCFGTSQTTAQKSAAVLWSVRMFVLLLFLAATTSTWAQTIRFRAGQVRVTVPLNSNNLAVITNYVNLSGGATNAIFDVSGLPAGYTGSKLTDANTNALLLNYDGYKSLAMGVHHQCPAGNIYFQP